MSRTVAVDPGRKRQVGGGFDNGPGHLLLLSCAPIRAGGHHVFRFDREELKAKHQG